jgi:hypothetical protein
MRSAVRSAASDERGFGSRDIGPGAKNRQNGN